MNTIPELPGGFERVDDACGKVWHADALALLRALPDNSVDCIVTSPPYYNLRDYGHDQQIGLEETPAAFVAKLTEVFREARRVLRVDGTFWLNLGDTYTGGGRGRGAGSGKQVTNAGACIDTRSNVDGLPDKSLIGIPWRVAFALQDDGWILRNEIIWHKPNLMPESVTDRCTRSHETVFLFAKSGRYWFDADAIAEPALYDGRKDTLAKGSPKYEVAVVPGQSPQGFASGVHERWRKNADGQYIRNKRDVWTVATEPNNFAHFATFPRKLIEPMILAGCPAGGVVLDMFMGSGTTALVARQLGRRFIGGEINAEYVQLAERRLAQPYTPNMFETLEVNHGK